MIKEVTIEYLLNEFEGEGIVAIGCGGDINEWFNGVNFILTSSKVTSKPQAIGDAYKFENDEVTCLLFPFPKDSDDFNIGRLAIVRLEYPWMKWWSDYKDNIVNIEYVEDVYNYDDDYYDEDDEDCPLFTPDDDEGCPVCGSYDVTYKPGLSRNVVAVCNHCGFVDCDFDESEV